MTDTEILEKALWKACHNGYSTGVHYQLDKDMLKMSVESKAYYNLIFDIEFAKAFWGGGRICMDCGCTNILKDELKTYGCCNCGLYESVYIDQAWKYHLKEMVVQKEPLKYIEGFLDK